MLIFIVGALIIALPSLAATVKKPTPKIPAYAAKQLIASPPVNQLDQKEVYSYTIGFKNTGTAVWLSDDNKKPITIKTTERVRWEHWFASASWLDKTAVTALATETVKPGEVGFFTLILEAPLKANSFTNRFALFAGNNKIAGTDFTLPITVTKKIAAKAKQKIAPTIARAAVTDLKTNPYLKATRLIQSDQSLSLTLGESKAFTIGFKNSGERNWRDDAPSRVVLALDPASISEITLNDEKWLSNTEAATLQDKLAKPGEIGYFTFTVKPLGAGSFQPQFRLVMNGDTLIQGSEFRLPMAVISPPPPPTLASNQTPSNTPATAPNIVCAASLDTGTVEGQPPTQEGQTQQQLPTETGLCQPPHSEPTVRVGIASVQGQIGLTAAEPFQIMDNAGAVLMNVESNIPVFLAYDPISKNYTAIGPGPIILSPLPLRAKTVMEPSIMTLSTFNNPTAFDASLNDNVYRGAIEVHWSDNDQKLWMVNELGMEDYLRGLAETSNSSPIEFQKAQIVAARSYALYHYQTKTKHAARHFDVIATVGDQYYRGYNSELRLTNVSKAVDATRGQVVAYQKQVAITPYSASSNGTSRAWEDVWGGTPKPWLIRQPIPEDVGRKRFGHAVGMSQLAAQDQAKAGKNYVDILKFFYVSTEVTQWY